MLTQEIPSLMVVRIRTGNLDALRAIVHDAVPIHQTDPYIGPVCEDQGIPRVFLYSLGVQGFRFEVFAISERRVALFFQLVGLIGCHVGVRLCPSVVC